MLVLRLAAEVALAGTHLMKPPNDWNPNMRIPSMPPDALSSTTWMPALDRSSYRITALYLHS